MTGGPRNSGGSRDWPWQNSSVRPLVTNKHVSQMASFYPLDRHVRAIVNAVAECIAAYETDSCGRTVGQQPAFVRARTEDANRFVTVSNPAHLQ